MKNTILIMIMTLFLPTNFILAQPGGNLTLQPISCMSYTQNPELDKFIGTWKWVEGNDSFEIVLKKEKIFDLTSNNDVCIDIIIGFHEYRKNGNVIESSLQYINSNFYENLKTLFSPNYVVNSTILRGGLKILSTGNYIKFEISQIDSNHIKITSFENYPGIKLYQPGHTIPSSEIIFPVGVILTKQ